MALEQFLLDPSKIWTLLALLPLIILYLIRPKPKEKTIPSLMFFMRDAGAANRRSFFRRFTKDWLFWLQLLILIILALAVTKPFINVPETALAEHTIIVLDVSASMNAMKDGKTRFEEAKDIALDSLGKINTIIIAKNVPLVAKIEVDSKEARDFLKAIEPVGTSTGIYDASRAAMDYAGDGSRVLVISDFIETEVDSNINSVKRALKAKGAAVEFVSVTGPANNVGIVDLVVKDETTSVQVKNFFPTTQTVRILVGNIEETMTLEPGEADVLTFSTPTGVTTLELVVNDDFELDNKAFISTPEETSLRTLVITNDDEIQGRNMAVAWKAISDKTNYNIEREEVNPPKSVNVNHDLIILKNFDQTKILPGVFRDIEEQVEGGASLVIVAQRGLFAFSPIDPLLPILYEGENPQGSDIFIVEPEIESLTTDVNFGHVDYYFKTKPKVGARSIASAKADNSSIIALQQKGDGKILYYGIFDDDIKVDGETKRSTFKNDLFYPIFLKRVVDLLTETPSVDSLNQRTGRIIRLADNEQIKTPSGRIVKGIFMMDKQGVYNFKNQNIAANLLNSKESDISGQFTEIELPQKDGDLIESEKPKPLTMYFVIVGIILLLLELIYMKLRGDM